MECTLTRLLKDGTASPGRLATGARMAVSSLFKARSIVLATGGWGRMYKVTSNSWEGTGDGVAMAYEAGAELRDTEMVQFHPTGMVWPPGVRGILVTEGVRGEGGILKNSEGERFMLRYDPKKKELSSRDVVARSIYREVQEGRGSEHGGAYLDISHQAGGRLSSASCRRCTSSFSRWRTSTSPDSRWKWRRPSTTPWAGSGSRPKPEPAPFRGSSPPVRSPPACTAPTASAAIR